MLKTNSDPVEKNKITSSLGDFKLEKRRLPKLPWLFFMDIVGLLVAISLVIWQIGDAFAQSPVRVFVMLLIVFGFNTRVFLGHMKSIETLLNKTRLILLLAPTIAAISTVTVQALSRSYYSGMALIIFVMFPLRFFDMGRCSSRMKLWESDFGLRETHFCCSGNVGNICQNKYLALLQGKKHIKIISELRWPEPMSK